MIRERRVLMHKKETRFHVAGIIGALVRATEHMEDPAAQQIIAEFGKDPYLILVSCLLSLRTKDAVSLEASRRLFKFVRTPNDALAVSSLRIERAIYPVGFFRQKAKTIKRVSRVLLERYGGVVPDVEIDLLSLPGVGRKTANLVRAEAFGIDAICVDTHVHRISNRLGLVKTKTPEETEHMLKKIVPRSYWILLNRLLVMWGQNICAPISPFCSRCVIKSSCKQVGVNKFR
jgi:endonuclease-3